MRASVARWILVGTVVLALGRVCAHEFTWWDDPLTIEDNPRLNPPTFKSISWYWAHSEYGLYVPVTYTFWGGIAWLGRWGAEAGDPNPWIFHAANLGVHVVAVLLVFELLRALNFSVAAGLAGAALFGLHPFQVEPVAWASGTKDVLGGMFVMAALYQYVRYAKAGANMRAAMIHAGLATVFFVATMLSKPSAMVLPAMAGVIDILILRRPARRVVLLIAPWLALSAACMVWTKLSQPAELVYRPPFHLRFLVAGDALAFYLAKLFWPVRQGFDYGRRPEAVLAASVTPLLALAPIATAVLIALWRKSWPWMAASGLLMAVALSPVLGFVPFLFQGHSTVADHYMYFAMIGPAIAFAWVMERVAGRRIWVLAAGLLLLLAGRSFVQAGTWRDNRTLCGHALSINPLSFAAHNNMGGELLASNDPLGAERHLLRAVEINKTFVPAYDKLAQVAVMTGRVDEGIEHMKTAMRLRSNAREPSPQLVKHLLRLGDILAERGRHAEAAEQFREALRHDPANIEAREKLRRSESASPATMNIAGPATAEAH